MNESIRHRQVSLRDIARRMGVSHATVSLAMRDHSRISPGRIAEIKRIAGEMGYRPEPMLGVLNAYRRDRHFPAPVQPGIAWLNFWTDPAALRRFREFDGYWRGAGAIAAKCGFSLEEICVAQVGSACLSAELRKRGVQGVLLPPLPRSGDVLELDRWNWQEYPIVGFGHTLADLPVTMVTCDQAATARAAFCNARSLGYERIGLVMTDRALNTTLFAAGFLGAQYDVPESTRIPILSLPAGGPGSCAKQLAEWVRRFRPDALVTGVAELRDCLGSIGIQVPQDMGLAALSVLDGNADAGIDQYPEEIGHVAAETLISLINSGQRGPLPHRRKILVAGQWLNGSTLPDRRAIQATGDCSDGRR